MTTKKNTIIVATVATALATTPFANADEVIEHPEEAITETIKEAIQEDSASEEIALVESSTVEVEPVENTSEEIAETTAEVIVNETPDTTIEVIEEDEEEETEAAYATPDVDIRAIPVSADINFNQMITNARVTVESAINDQVQHYQRAIPTFDPYGYATPHIKNLLRILDQHKIDVDQYLKYAPVEIQKIVREYQAANAPVVTPATAPAPVAVQSPQPYPAPAPVPTNSQASNAVDFAHSRIGTPYVYGGTTDAGYDCSGFVQAAYRSTGVNIPRTTQQQAVYGQSVSRADLQPGDLVFYGYNGPASSYHAAIYIGDGKVIHSPQSGDSVKVSSIDMAPISSLKRPA